MVNIIGRKFHDIDMVNVASGKQLKLSDLLTSGLGKPLVVCFYTLGGAYCGEAAKEMEKHAAMEANNDKATFVLICTDRQIDTDALLDFETEHSLKAVTHCAGRLTTLDRSAYGLEFCPHHVVIGPDSKIKMNLDKPSCNYMDFLSYGNM